MGMGIVSDKEFNNEREKLAPNPKIPMEGQLIEGRIIDTTKGRGNGNKEVPNSLRNIIGETSTTEGRKEAVELAKNFGIGESSVSAYTKGATSTASYEERPNGNVIQGVKDRIATKARVKLIKAINHITDDKLAAAKLGEISSVAKDMSTVMKNMESDSNQDGARQQTGPTFVFYSPQIRKEEVFDTVLAKE